MRGLPKISQDFRKQLEDFQGVSWRLKGILWGISEGSVWVSVGRQSENFTMARGLQEYLWKFARISVFREVSLRFLRAPRVFLKRFHKSFWGFYGSTLGVSN